MYNAARPNITRKLRTPHVEYNNSLIVNSWLQKVINGIFTDPNYLMFNLRGRGYQSCIRIVPPDKLSFNI